MKEYQIQTNKKISIKFLRSLFLVFIFIPYLSFAQSSFTTSLTTVGVESLPPTIPTNLSAVPVSYSQVDLSWTASDVSGRIYDIAGYRIFRDSLFLATTTSLNYSDIGLLANTTYEYTVEAFDTIGQLSGHSATSTAITLSLPVTPPPSSGSGSSGGAGSNLNISNIKIVPSNTQAEIFFKTNFPAQIKIQWGFSGDFEIGSLQNPIYGTEHSQIINGLSEGLTYKVRITATQSNGVSVYKDISFNTTQDIIEISPLPNPSDFIAIARDKDIKLSWKNPSDPRFDDVRIVKAEGFYPIDQFDGVPIYEGNDESFIDIDVEEDTIYYYAIFSRDSEGQYSSGALAQAQLVLPGQVPIDFSDPFANIPQAENVDPMLKNLTLSDFEFIQDGKLLAVVGNTIAIDGGKNLTIKLKYDKVPEILKTIAFTLQDPKNKDKVFPFLLRVNSDRTYYEATIGALGKSGRYGLSIAILDYENQGLVRLGGTIAALAFGASVLDFGEGFDFLGLLVLLLILALLMIVVILLRRWINNHPENIFDKTDPKSKVITTTVLLFLLPIISLVFVISSTKILAASNPQINYQGKIVTSSNVIVADGDYNLRFKLYTAIEGGSPVWTETWCNTSDCAGTGIGDDNRVRVVNGLFSVMLGSTTALTGIDFDQPLYLSVEIGGSGNTASWDGEMVPRKIIGTVPSAFVANNASLLAGLNPTQFIRSDTQNATSSSSTFLNVIQTGAGKIAEFFGSASQSVMALLSNGNVGIGTSSPYAKLSVVGETVSEYFTATSTTATSTFAGGLQAGGSSGLYVLRNGKIGIGRGNPVGQLDVVAPSVSSVAEDIAFFKVSDASNSYFGISNGSAVNNFFMPTLTGRNGDDQRTGLTFVAEVDDATYTGGQYYPAMSFAAQDRDDSSTLSVVPILSFRNQANVVLQTWYDSRTKIGGTDVQNFAGGALTRPGTMLDVIGNGSDDLLNLIDSTTSRLIVKESGNVGIGTTSPYAKLSVEGSSVLGNSALAGYFTATSTSIASTFPYASTTALTVSGNAYLTALSSGGVGVGSNGNLYSYSTSTWTFASSTLLSDNNTFTGTNTFGALTASTLNATTLNLGSGFANMLASFDPSGNLTSTSSPQVAYINATSTTATSTFAGDVTINKDLMFPNSTSHFHIGNYSDLSTAFNMTLGLNTNTNLIDGLDFKNSNSSGQVRLMARNNANDYLVMNTFGSSNSASFFGQTGSNISAIFSQAASDTDKKLAIGTFNAGDLILGTSNTERMRILSDGNIGIGTTSPFTKLSVAGSTYIGGNLTATGTIAFPSISSGALGINSNGNLYSYSTSTWTFASSTLLTDNNTFTGTNTFSTLTASTLNATTLNLGSGFANMLASFDSSGNLTSTSSPQVAYINATSTTATSTFAGGLSIAGTSGLTVLQNGNVGVGTDVPVSQLDVFGAITLSGTNQVSYLTPVGSLVPTKINVPIFDPGQYGQIISVGLPILSDSTSRVISIFDARPTDHQPTIGVFSPNESDMFGFSWEGSNSNAYLKSLSSNIRFRIDTRDIATFNNDGNVGLSTTSPFAKLSVAGSTYIGGDLTATGTIAFPSISSGALGINSNGNLYSYSTSTWTFASSTLLTDNNTFTGTNTFSTLTASTLNATTLNLGSGFANMLASFDSSGNLTSTSSPQVAYINATSTTIASTFPYASTTALTVSGINGLQLSAGLNGPLQALNGLVSSTSTLSIYYGGTGTSTAPNYGQLLIGDGLGKYTLSGTSTLGLLSSSVIGSGSTGYIPYYASSGQTLTATSSIFINTNQNIGIGTESTPSKLSVLSTISPQLRLSYDSSNYLTAGISSSGGTTLAINGSLGGLTITNPQPASVSNANGTDAPNSLSVTGATGGGVSGITGSGSATAGVGGGLSLAGGTGGNANDNFIAPFLDTVSLTGGAGGEVSLSAGGGGSATYLPFPPDSFDLQAFGGSGGNFLISAGNGGLAGSYGTSDTGGNGGNLYLSGGRGGQALGSALSSTNGTAGNVYLGYNNSSQVGNVYFGNQGASYITSTGNFGIGTTSPYAKLSVVGQTVSQYFTATSSSATSTLPLLSTTVFNIGNDYITDITGAGLQVSGGVLSVTSNNIPSGANLLASFDPSGNLTSTSSPQVAYINATSTTATSTFSGKIHVIGQTTLSYASTTALTISGDNGLQLTSNLNGPLQAINGLVSSTSTLSISYGGTGTTTNPGYGQLLIGDGSGSYTLSGTSTLGILASSAIGVGDAGYIPYYTSTEKALTATSSIFIADSGYIGIGTTTPSSKLSVLSSNSPQLRLAYDKDNYLTTGISSNGGTILAINGTYGGFSITNPQPVAVESGSGTNAPYSLSVIGATGGNSLDTNIGAGGNGGGIQLTSGTGGTSILSTSLETGGNGGVLSLTSGAGGGASAATQDFMTRVGGNGGLVSFIAGNGGDATNGGLASTNTAGSGGSFILKAGTGGNASGATSNTGGNGGNLYLSGGAGGTGSTVNGSVGSIYLGYDSSSQIGNIYFGNQGASYITSTGNFGIGTTSPFAKLSVAGSTYIGGDLTATGTIAFPSISSGALGINSNGNLYSYSTSTWTFASSTLLSDNNTFTGTNTFGTLTASTLNATTLNLGSGFANMLASFDPSGNLTSTSSPQVAYINATSTTIASTFPYASTTALTVSGINGLTLGSLTGPLQALNGAVSASTTLSVAYGGTGSTTLSGLLKGNGTGQIQTAIPGVDYLTSLSGAASSTLLTDNNTFSGTNTFGTLTASILNATTLNLGSGFANMLTSFDPSGNLTSTSSPQVAYINATSTTATSTFAGGLQAGGSSGLYVLQNGNVGVGTSTPADKLHISGFIRTDNVDWLLSQDFGADHASIEAMVVYNGNLYAGVGNGSVSGSAKVFVFDGNNWVLSTDFGGSFRTVESLGVYNGRLYAGTGDQNGSAEVYVFDGTNWVLSNDFGANHKRVQGLVSYDNKLFIGLGDTAGVSDEVHYFDGTSWVLSNNFGPDFIRVNNFAVYNGKLYASVSSSVEPLNTTVYVFDGSSWSISKDLGSYAFARSMAVYNGKLYVGMGDTSGSADLYSYDGRDWVLVNDFGAGYRRIESLTVYNNRLFIGLGYESDDADLYVYDGYNFNLSKDFGSDIGQVEYMTVYNGKLYAGTGRLAGDAAIYVYSDRLESQLVKDFDLSKISFNEQYQHFSKDLTVLGNIGVGTSSPYSKLSVWGSGTGTNRLFELTNSASTTIASFLENGTGYFLGNIGLATTSPFAKLSVAGSTYIGGDLTATGTIAFPSISSGALGINSNGNLYSYSTSTWTFASSTLLSDNNTFTGTNTFGTLTASTLNATTLNLGSGFANMLASFDPSGNLTSTSSPQVAYITATSTSIASTFPYASTTALTVSGTNGLQLSTGLNGPLQALNGLVSSTSTLSVAYGGTGSTTLSGILKGNGTGQIQTAIPGVDYLTSLSGAASSTLLSDNNTFTGTNTFGTLTASTLNATTLNLGSGFANMLVSFDPSGNLTSTSSPQVAYINATSTTATSTFAGGLQAGGSSGLYVLQNGFVGIGTTTPLRALTVSGTGSQSQILLESTSAPTNQRFWGLNASSTGSLSINSMTDTLVPTSRLTIDSSGNVGIGTTSPFVNLSVAGQVYAESSNFPVLGFRRLTTETSGAFTGVTGIASAMGLYTQTSGNMADGFGGGIVFYGKDPGVADTAMARIYARRDGADTEGALQFFNGTSGNDPTMIIRSSGNVGIGTVAPGATLDVMANAVNSTAEDISKFSVSDAANTYLQIKNGSTVNGAMLNVFYGVNGDDGRDAMRFESNVLDTAYNSDIYPSMMFRGFKGTPTTALSVTPVVSFANAHEAVFTTWYDARTKIGGTDTLNVVGEGATRPTTMLDVIGNGSDDLLNLIDSTTSRLIVKESGNVGIGTTSPYAKLSVVGPVVAEYFTATSTTATSTIYGFLDVLGTGTNATSTIQSNLWVKGNLRAGVSYVGDLFFANNFSFTESLPINNIDTQGIYLKNQHGEKILSVDDTGNLNIVGDICLGSTSCMSDSLSKINSDFSTLASSTAELQNSISGLVTDITKNTTSSVKNLAETIVALELKVDALIASSTINTDLIASTSLALSTNPEFISKISSSTADTLSLDSTFIQTIANAVKNIITSTQDWVVEKFTAKIAYINRVEAETVSISKGIEMIDQVSGAVWCVTISNGDWKKVQGSCANIATSTIATPQVINTPVSTPAPTPAITIQPSTNDSVIISSTTESEANISSEISTTTPILDTISLSSTTTSSSIYTSSSTTTSTLTDTTQSSTTTLGSTDLIPSSSSEITPSPTLLQTTEAVPSPEASVSLSQEEVTPIPSNSPDLSPITNEQQTTSVSEPISETSSESSGTGIDGQ